MVGKQNTGSTAGLRAASETTQATVPQNRQGVMGRAVDGHGRRLTAAFEALESFPALAESRKRIIHLAKLERADFGEIVSAIEADVAMVIAVIRLANHNSDKQINTVVEAVKTLTPDGVETLVASMKSYNFFESSPHWNGHPEQFRLHAVTTQQFALRVADEVSFRASDELLVSALLHDIGKLVLSHAYSGYREIVLTGAKTPEERLWAERHELGMDHATVGGVLARRWDFPNRLASIIERHHSDAAPEEAMIIRLADMLAHYSHEQPVNAEELLKAAKRVGLRGESLRNVLYDIPYGERKGRHIEDCPLSNREMDVLKLLAGGNVYKQIAVSLGLSTSTVRTHLHNVYGKLGAVDRAQAVLFASEKGWI